MEDPRIAAMVDALPLPGDLRRDHLEDDVRPLEFGKYRGQTPTAVAEHDPSYVVWMHDNVRNHLTCSRALRDACEQDLRDAEADGWDPEDGLHHF